LHGTVAHTRSRQLLLMIDGYALCVPRMGINFFVIKDKEKPQKE